MTIKNSVLAAVDDGYAETKVVLEDGSKYRFPSMVRQGGVLGQTNDEIHSYETANEEGEPTIFTATGAFDTEAQSTRFESYPYSAENRVMIHHALRRAGLGGARVKIATSLPVGEYFNGGGVDKRVLENKSANVLKPVRSTSPGEACAEIVESKIFAEGVAAWVDFAVSEAGEFRVVLKRSAAVVDIGGNTTDTVKVLKQLSVEKSSSGTLNVGVLNVYEELARLVTMHPEITDAFPRLKASSVPRSMLEHILLTGKFTEKGLTIDMSHQVKSAKSTVASKILRDVEMRLSAGFDLETLLFVGGGAAVLKDEIKAKYRTAEFIDEPEYANARGMLKMMLFG